MVLLGLLLLVASGAAVVLLLVDNMSEDAVFAVTLLGSELATVDAPTIFVAGLVLAAAFCLGLALVAVGSRRARGRRAAMRDAQLRADEAAAERDALASRVADDSRTDDLARNHRTPGP